MASSGGKVLFSETTLRASKEKTNTNANAIPMAKFIPKPPLFFCEESESAKKVRIMIETGIAVR